MQVSKSAFVYSYIQKQDQTCGFVTGTPCLNLTICKSLLHTDGLFFTSGPKMRKIPHHRVGHGTFYPLTLPYVSWQYPNVRNNRNRTRHTRGSGITKLIEVFIHMPLEFKTLSHSSPDQVWSKFGDLTFKILHISPPIKKKLEQFFNCIRSAIQKMFRESFLS